MAKATQKDYFETPLPFRTAYDGKQKEISDAAALYCPPEEGMTKQEFAEDCDINTIMKRYERTGILPDNALAAKAQYGDFSQIPDFMQMQEKVLAAHEMFDALPAAVRKQFDNDPGQFIAAADTAEGRALLIKFGLGSEPDPSKPEGAPQAAPKATEPEKAPAPPEKVK